MIKKRLKKKLEKRAGRMHYSDARMELLMRAVRRAHPDAGAIIIETSKSGRCIEKITTCIGPVYPSGVSNPPVQYVDIYPGGSLNE